MGLSKKLFASIHGWECASVATNIYRRGSLLYLLNDASWGLPMHRFQCV